MTQEQWQKLVEMAEAIKQELRGRGKVAFGGMETEDAVQDVLLKEWKSRGKITSYLPRRMKLNANNVVYKKQNPKLHVSDEVLKDEPAPDDEPRRDLLDIFLMMSRSPKVFSPRSLSVFVLRAQGESYKEIGERFKVTTERARQIQGETMRRIREMIQEESVIYRNKQQERLKDAK